MRFELWLFVIVCALLFHVYSDGKYVKKLMSYKKYLQMGGILVGACIFYVLIKKNPKHAENIIMGSNEYLKYLPVDKNTTSMISPILDFTSKRSFSRGGATPQEIGQENGFQYPVLQVPTAQQRSAENVLLRSGKQGTKRSVSETKKKFVASRQSWKCGGCQKMLNAWFEVDHKIRLADGGSNHVDNLVAYCRECHGEKTAIENL